MAECFRNFKFIVRADRHCILHHYSAHTTRWYYTHGGNCRHLRQSQCRTSSQVVDSIHTHNLKLAYFIYIFGLSRAKFSRHVPSTAFLLRRCASSQENQKSTKKSKLEVRATQYSIFISTHHWRFLELVYLHAFLVLAFISIYGVHAYPTHECCSFLLDNLRFVVVTLFGIASIAPDPTVRGYHIVLIDNFPDRS